MTTIEKAAGEYAHKIDEETKSSLHPKTASFQGFIAGAEFVHSIDWEQRRYEIAKAAMQGILTTEREEYHYNSKSSLVKDSIEYADELINQLKTLQQ